MKLHRAAVRAKPVNDLAVDSGHRNLGWSTCRRQHPRHWLDHLQALWALAAAASDRVMTEALASKRRWTQTDISQLRREAADGANIDALSVSLSRDADEVFRMATRLNVAIIVTPAAY